MQEQLQQKQQLLRSQILESGVDAQAFMNFMGTVKQEGENIDLNNWSLAELKDVVKEFKDSRQMEVDRINSQILANRLSKQLMTTKIMESIQKKQKVFYDQYDLWDYEIKTQQQCKKAKRVFDFKVEPQIDYKSWDIKKTGGIIFGIGARNQLDISFITNFTPDIVTRKNEDADWLRQMLCLKYPGSYIPPLEQARYLEPEDKTAIMKRVKQVIMFLNSILNYEHLVQNNFFYQFIAEKDPKVFATFKSRQPATRINGDIGLIQNLQGKFSVQISKRALTFIKQSSQFGRGAEQIHQSMENNFRKMLADFQALSKHTLYVANDFTKFHEKYNRMSERCKIGGTEQGQKMGSILAFLHNMFSNMGNQFKKQFIMVRDMTEQFLRYSHSEWIEFVLHEKRYNNQLSNYLNLKYNLQKKKERNLTDVSKWELDEKEQFRVSRLNTNKMDKEQAFEIMFPKDNRVEEETRIWQAYINDMYEKTFKMLIDEQEKMYVKNFGRFCFKLEKLTKEQNQTYKRFGEIFDLPAVKNDSKQ